MAQPHLIGPTARTTPPDAAGARAQPRPLPDDLLRDASRRLGIMALVAGAVWTLGWVLGLVATMRTTSVVLGGSDAIVAASVLISLLLFVYARTGQRNPRTVLDLGLAYMVVTAGALSLSIHWLPMAVDQQVSPGLSWVGAVVLMFAAIVPSTPVKTAVAGFVAASMNPIAMLIARAAGRWQFDSALDAVLMHYPDYLLAGVAVVISHIFTSLGQQVAKARELGSYQLGALLGRGGMGEVYRATHRMLARPAAIKLIRPEMIRSGDSSEVALAMTRFRREAETAASLRSPHTVELYDFGVTDDQSLYFVMELLEGLDLESLVRQHGPVPAARVIHLLRQVCASLEEAHARGLVHRDIKPANIHVGRLGLVYDFVKVLDFGLVKPITNTQTEPALGTQAGLVVGTPGYMAPEIALGDIVDGRADLYAVGCVGYYLLTGLQVFEGNMALGVMAKHLQSAPVPPSQRVPFAIEPSLERVVMECLAKKPEDRPRTAAELARRLTLADVAPWTHEQAEAWWSTVGVSTPVVAGDEITRI